MHASHTAHRKPALWLVAIVGCLALLLATPALSHAEESNPNNYTCVGNIGAGEVEEGSEEQQVKYQFFCNGPISGYQVESQIPLTGAGAAPLVSTLEAGFKEGPALKDTFSCSSEVPGFAVNCVGAAKAGYEIVKGQVAIGTKLCAEPRVDPLLTVTYAYLEKGAITQAISGPFDLGRPTGCPHDALSGSTRLDPHPPIVVHKKAKKKSSTKPGAKKAAKKAVHHR